MRFMGNVDFGRICYAIKITLTIIWIIFIGIPLNMVGYRKWPTGRIHVFIDLWIWVFTRLTGDILEISVFMQTNDSNDAPPIVGTSYGPEPQQQLAKPTLLRIRVRCHL